jgi:spore coat polysaccharide biosynthesis protein SpsF
MTQNNSNYSFDAIIQARMGSTRFPGKTLANLNNKPVLKQLIERLSLSKELNNIIIATTDSSKEIINFCKKEKINYFVGSENNVIERVINTSLKYNVDYIVDITSDCPLIDYIYLDKYIKFLKDNPSYDYASNVVERSYPDGFDIQIYKKEALIKCKKLIENPKHYSHTGWNITNNKLLFKIKNFKATGIEYMPELGLTIDEPEDLSLLSKIFENFENKYFSTKDTIKLLFENKELLNINKNVKRKIPGEG